MKQFVFILALGCTGSLIATPPAWWTTGSTAIIEPGATPNNGGPAAVGQLKNVAKKAALYLNNTLPAPGAGAAVNNLVAGFERNGGDLSPVSIGQLRFVTKPFYDRLRDVGYNTKQNLINHGAPGWAYDYPWDPATPKATSLLVANTGQLKWVFSFDLTGFTITDTDTDGMPNAWETAHGLNGGSSTDASADPDHDGLTNLQEYQQGSDPQDYFSQGVVTITPRVFVYGGGGSFTPYGQVSAEPVVFKVVNAATNATLVNAPVTISISGGGWVAATSGGTGSASLVQLSDAQGLTKVYFVAPPAP